MRPIAITVAGETYSSISAACERFGVSPQTAARRLRDGWSAEQAFGLELAPASHHDGIEVRTSEGVFRSVSEAAARFGLKAGTIHARLRKGWSPDEAVGIAKRPRSPKNTGAVSCAGERFPNIKSLAERYGLRRALVYKRIRSGWTPEQAVERQEPPPRFRNQVGGARTRHWKKVDVVDGKEMPGGEAGEYKLYVIRNSVNGREYVGITVTPLALRLRGHRKNASMGVKGKLYNAMRRYGADAFSIELIRNDARDFGELQRQEIAEIACRDTLRNGYNTSPGGSIGTSKSISVGGRHFSSLAAAAAYFGIDTNVFGLRLRRLGWTPEQAAEIEPRERHARRRVQVAGRGFPSLKAAAANYGLDYGLVHSRVVANGWSVEQALGIAPAPGTSRYQGVKVRAFGKDFASFAACAREFGVKPESLRNRVVNMGRCIEESINHLLSQRHKRF
ncbi:GIY-YIG nuclease family protein [Burkholderiaceae bacterium FT117]|uniref:GIY-YIG nuclease family protein n=1 Tax=Zeimonas sediminis TaxID=2944268 RepID=UPI002343058A|nr:GIY-YIG nuclease family protein [Zeimonas sediminis]MCM5569395.1 GIY-YIG nuclease family protein [Zeimonas sediminis]